MTKKIELALLLGKTKGAKALLSQEYNKEHKSAWDETMRGEYDSFAYEDIETEVFAEDGITVEDTLITSTFINGTISFNEWQNETRVTQEAVDATGTLEDDTYVEPVPEITEQVRPFIAMTTEEVAAQVDSYIYAATLPKVVTMRQARLALLQGDLLQTVTDAIANGTDEAMKIEWEYATEVKRDWSSLITLTTQLGMTSEQLDELFILAGIL